MAMGVAYADCTPTTKGRGRNLWKEMGGKMRKTYCDICGNEIVRQSETWRYELMANRENKRVALNESVNEICETCATIISCCVTMRRNGINSDWSGCMENSKSELLAQ